MAKPASDTTNERRHIQSINVGFALIRCIVDSPRPLSLKELADGARMSSSQAHLYMASFLKEKLVIQDRTTNRYELGPYALDMGLAALRKIDVIEYAKPVMYELQQGVGEAVFLALWGNRGPCIVAKVDGTRRSAMQLRVGYVLPLLETATGRLFLAHVPAQESADLLRLERRTASAKAPSRKEIEDIRTRTLAVGLGVSDNLRKDGFSSLSGPVFDHSGSMRAALTVTGPTEGFDIRVDGVVANALRAACADVSRLIGWKPPATPR